MLLHLVVNVDNSIFFAFFQNDMMMGFGILGLALQGSYQKNTNTPLLTHPVLGHSFQLPFPIACGMAQNIIKTLRMSA